MIIRDADLAEFPDLARLQIESWRSVYRGIMPDDYLDRRIEPELLAHWAELSLKEDDLVLVAIEGDIKGFVTVWCQPDPYIDNLHVDPTMRSRGIGRLLMKAVAARLIKNGYDKVELNVAAGNLRAAAFYRSLGGRFGEIRPMHQIYGDTIDAISVTWNDLQALARA